MVYTFKNFFNLLESEKQENLANSLGVFHELHVAKHLLGGKHPGRHPDANGERPHEAYAKHEGVIRQKAGEEGLKRAKQRAEEAAEHLKKHYAKKHPHHYIHDVHWTSKPGDVTRTVGEHLVPKGTDQTRERADIIVELKPKKKTVKEAAGDKDSIFSAVSLKAYSSNQGAEGMNANPGMNAAGPKAKAHVAAHREAVLKTSPALRGMKNKDARKKYLLDNPKHKEKIKGHVNKLLDSLASTTHEHVSSMNAHHKANWVRKHVLGASVSPLHDHPEGHESIRLTTDRVGGNSEKGSYRHKIDYPSEEHSDLNGEHIHTEHHGRHVRVFHRGKHIGTLSFKMNSESDPLSSIKAHGRMRKIGDHDDSGEN